MIYIKCMLFNKFKKCILPVNWEYYRLQRNVIKLKDNLFFFSPVLGALNIMIFGLPSSPFSPKRCLIGALKFCYQKMKKLFQTKRMYARFSHYEYMPMLYTAIFHGCKKDTCNFQVKNCDVFFNFAQNIEIRKNANPCKPQFYYIKVGRKGVYITQTCYPDE